MKPLLKWPLIITFGVIVVRIILEETGAPRAINTIVGVVWLQLLVPVYFGLVLANRQDLPRYVTLAKLVVLYALFTRLMVLVSYSLAYVFQWSAPRFNVEGGGVVGEGVTPARTGFTVGFPVYPQGRRLTCSAGRDEHETFPCLARVTIRRTAGGAG